MIFSLFIFGQVHILVTVFGYCFLFLSWICNACVGTTHEGRLVVFITVQNLAGIDAVVLIICTSFDFASLA